MVYTGNMVYKCIQDPDKRAVIQQHGVDLTVVEINKILPEPAQGDRPQGIYCTGAVNAKTASMKDDFVVEGRHVWNLQPGIYTVYFDQGCKIPENAKANLIHRSSLARAGAILTSAEYDPGFETNSMGAILTVVSPLVIEKHSRIAQMIVYEVADKVDTPYKGHYQNER